MEGVEYWRWRYRDPVTGLIEETAAWLTEEQALRYTDAERIDETRIVIEPAPPFDDTTPDVGPLDLL
jgi:hypothetical protein